MLKTILAVALGGIFLTSIPARADDKAPAAGEAKPDKPEKKQHKDKKDDSKKGEKAGGW